MGEDELQGAVMAGVQDEKEGPAGNATEAPNESPGVQGQVVEEQQAGAAHELQDDRMAGLQDGNEGQDEKASEERHESHDEPGQVVQGEHVAAAQWSTAGDGPEGEVERDGPQAAPGGPERRDQEFEQFPRASAELKAILEALIFASPDPLTPKAICKLLDNEPQEDVLAALVELRQDYERPGGLQLVEVAGGFQIVTRSDLHEWVRRLFHERSAQKLSVPALETLAVVAYRQPVTAAEITEIRGVNTSGVLNTLLERHLIKISGRKQVVGRPFTYATTKEFLIRFGLNSLADLPKVEDMAEALGIENPLLVEQSTSDELLPLEEPEVEGGLTAGPAELSRPGQSPSGESPSGESRSEKSPSEKSPSEENLSEESLAAEGTLDVPPRSS